MRVLVLGLQRSGNNYLQKLVEINANTELEPFGPREICWKHAMPWELQPNGLSAIDSISQYPHKLGVILTSKHPCQWLDSLVNRDPQDFFKSKKGAIISGEISLKACASIYNAYYSSWLAFIGHGLDLHVRYIDILVNIVEVIHKVCDDIDLSCKKAISIPVKVPYTKNFSEADKMRYTTGKCMLEESMLDEFMSYLDTAVLERLGYSKVDY